MSQLRPAALFLLAYMAGLLGILYAHALFGNLLQDAVLGVWDYYFVFLALYGLPALVGAIAVSLVGLSARRRLRLGAVYLTAIFVFFEVVVNANAILPYVLRDLMFRLAPFIFVAASCALSVAFVALAAQQARAA